MERWNSLSSSNRGLIVGGGVVVLIGAVILVGYFAGLRCQMAGSYFTCSLNEKSSTSLNQTTEEGLKKTPGEVENTPNTPLSESSNRPEPVYVSGDAVVANDQLAGPIVEVTMLTLSEPGWVAVYEDNAGAPGNVLGAARFEEGIHLGEISLLRSTSPGRTYYLILHADTNNREFDLKKNPVIVDSNGFPVRVSFRTFGED